MNKNVVVTYFVDRWVMSGTTQCMHVQGLFGILESVFAIFALAVISQM